MIKQHGEKSDESFTKSVGELDADNWEKLYKVYDEQLHSLVTCLRALRSMAVVYEDNKSTYNDIVYNLESLHKQVMN